MTKKKWLTSALVATMVLTSATATGIVLGSTYDAPTPVTAATWVDDWGNPNTNWSGDAATGTMTHTGEGWGEFSYALTGATVSGTNYTTSVTWQAGWNASVDGSSWLDIGLFGSYTDKDNYLLFVLRFEGEDGKSNGTSVLRHILANDRSGGADKWVDPILWSNGGTFPSATGVADRKYDSSKATNFGIERDGNKYYVTFNGVLLRDYSKDCTYEATGGGTNTCNKLGLYSAHNAASASTPATTVTFKNFAQANVTGFEKENLSFDNKTYTANQGSFSVSDGKLVHTTNVGANHENIAITAPFSDDDNKQYIMSATGTVTSGDTVGWGFVPYYADDRNYLVVTIRWGTTWTQNTTGEVEFQELVFTEVIGGYPTHTSFWADYNPDLKPFRTTLDRNSAVTLTVSRAQYEGADHYHVNINGTYAGAHATTLSYNKATNGVGFVANEGVTSFSPIQIRNNVHVMNATTFGFTSNYQPALWNVAETSATYNNDLTAFNDYDFNHALGLTVSKSGDYSVSLSITTHGTNTDSIATFAAWQLDVNNYVTVRLHFTAGKPTKLDLIESTDGVTAFSSIDIQGTNAETLVKVERITGIVDGKDVFRAYVNNSYVGEREVTVSVGQASAGTYMDCLGDSYTFADLTYGTVATTTYQYAVNETLSGSAIKVAVGDTVTLTADKANSMMGTDDTFIAWLVGTTLHENGDVITVTEATTITAVKLNLAQGETDLGIYSSLAGTQLTFRTIVDATELAYVQNALGATAVEYHTIATKSVYFNDKINYSLNSFIEGKKDNDKVSTLTDNTFSASYNFRSYELATAMVSKAYVLFTTANGEYKVEANGFTLTSSYSMLREYQEKTNSANTKYQKLLDSVVRAEDGETSRAVELFSALFIGNERIAIWENNAVKVLNDAYDVDYDGETLTWSLVSAE